MATGARGDCGMAAGVDWVVVDRIDCGVAGGEDCPGAGVRLYWGYLAGVDWIGDWWLDFYEVGDCARQYVSVFVGGGYSGGCCVGGYRAFDFWRKKVGLHFEPDKARLSFGGQPRTTRAASSRPLLFCLTSAPARMLVQPTLALGGLGPASKTTL